MHIPSRLFVAFVTGVTEAAWVAAAFQPLGLHHRHGTPFSDINSQAPAHARSSAVLTSTCARGNCRRRAILALKLSAKECGAEERAEDKDPPPNLDPRFYHLFDRSQSKVDQLEHADAMAKTGFELDGAVLINKAGQRIHPEALRGTSVALLFSAGWCADCQEFLPLLRAFYDEQNALAPLRGSSAEARSKVTIVYVSSDTSKEAAEACFREGHGDWLMLDYDSPLRQEFKQRHGVWPGVESRMFATSIEGFLSRRGGIPALAVLTAGGLLANYLDAEALGLECLLQWRPEDYKWE